MQETILKSEIEALTYQKIIKHLLEAVNDPREREKKRARIALRNINKWYQEAAVELAERSAWH